MPKHVEFQNKNVFRVFESIFKQFKIEQIDSAMKSAYSLSNQIGTTSGPDASGEFRAYRLEPLVQR